MKNSFTILLFLSIAVGFGQGNPTPKEEAILIKHNTTEKSDVSDYSQIFTSVQVQASPPGGMNALRKQIASSFRLPEVDVTTTGTIVVKFVVWDDGSIRDIVIVKESPAGLGLGKEAIRILNKSPKWTPGQVNGKIVKQYYTFPISFQIQGSGEDSQTTLEISNKELSTTVQDSSKTEFNQIFITVDEIAVPENGMNAFRQYIANSFNYPIVKKTLIAKVIAKFVVSEYGVISNVEIVKEEPLNLGLGKEAERVLLASSKWKPAIYKGKAVRQYYTLPITIQIEEEKVKK